MDEKDEKILDILRKNGRENYVDIAGEVGLTEGGVRNRVKRLVQSGVIEKFTIKQRDEKAIVLLKITTTKIRNVVRELGKLAEDIFELAGDYDIAVLLEANTMEELNGKVDAIRELPAVSESRTLVKLVER